MPNRNFDLVTKLVYFCYCISGTTIIMYQCNLKFYNQIIFGDEYPMDHAFIKSIVIFTNYNQNQTFHKQAIGIDEQTLIAIMQFN